MKPSPNIDYQPFTNPLPMNPYEQAIQHETRRQFFGRGAKGLGAAALSSLLAKESVAGQQAGVPRAQLPVAKAKRAIYLFMSGGPAQMDMYD